MSEVTRLNDQGMITLRTDLAQVPNAPHTRKIADGVAWMSPDELLILVPKADVPATLSNWEKTLAGKHHLLADVSDARALFQLSGPNVREVLAKGAPVDLSPDMFQIGDIRRTRIGQVAAAFWLVDNQTFHIVCFTSVSGYLEDWLRHASRESAMVTYF